MQVGVKQNKASPRGRFYFASSETPCGEVRQGKKLRRRFEAHKVAPMKMQKPRNQVFKQFLDLQPADLNNRRTLCKLYLNSVLAGIWGNKGPNDVLDFMALAAKAVRDDTYGTPGVLLWYLLQHDARDRITGAHEQSVLLRWSSQERWDLYEDTCAQNNARGKVHTQIPPLTYDPDYEELRGYHHSFLLQCPFLRNRFLTKLVFGARNTGVV